MKKPRKKAKTLICKVCSPGKKLKKKTKCCSKKMTAKEKGTWNA